MPSEILVIVTARNEEERIAATLAALAVAFPGAPVWVADDGSSDSTASLALAGGARLVPGGRPKGKGAAATAAARQALEHARARPPGSPPALFLLCDGDLADSAGRLGALAGPLLAGEAELAVARFSRRRGGGFGIVVAYARRAIERRTSVAVEAPISGQRALTQDTLEDVLPFAAGFGMEVGMTIDALRAGHRLVEVELDLQHRSTGRTPAGFAHRARQLLDIARAQRSRA
jgi:glycosyltransferase involved in cell wall biosynthesis